MVAPVVPTVEPIAPQPTAVSEEPVVDSPQAPTPVLASEPALAPAVDESTSTVSDPVVATKPVAGAS